jgi:hypothetical protein
MMVFPTAMGVSTMRGKQRRIYSMPFPSSSEPAVARSTYCDGACVDRPRNTNQRSRVCAYSAPHNLVCSLGEG